MLRVENIIKSFDSLQVLKGISLQVEPGEIVSIVGPSGAGKSTLLHIMGSLESPDSGSVFFNDINISKMGQRELAAFRNRNIGFVFQFHRLLPEFSMIENVAMPALIAGESKKEAFAHAERFIEYLGLSARSNHRPNELSGGERQRAAVARALVNNPGVILADEPSGSLDSENRKELHKLFFDLRRDFGHTFIIVTHDESLAASADREIHLSDGKIVSVTPNLKPQSK